MSTKEKTKIGERQYTTIKNAIGELNESRTGMDEFVDSGDKFVSGLQGIIDGDKEVCVEDVEAMFGMYVDEMITTEKTVSKTVKIVGNSMGLSGSNGWSVDDVCNSALGEIAKLDIGDVKCAIGLDQLRKGKVYDDLVEGCDYIEELKPQFKELRELEELVINEDYTPLWEWLVKQEWAQKIESPFDGSGIPYTLRDCLALNIWQQAREIRNQRCFKKPHHVNLVLQEFEESNRNVLNSLKEWAITENVERDIPIENSVLLKKLRAAFWAGTNFQAEPPLQRVLIAGHLGLGQLVKMQQLVRRRRSSASAAVAGINLITTAHSDHSESSSGNVSAPVLSRGRLVELTQEIEVPSFVGGHPVHVCPVLRQETCGNTKSSNANPALALPCGHVVGAHALGRLATGTVGDMRSTRGGPLGPEVVKCPYCPLRSAAREARSVIFVGL